MMLSKRTAVSALFLGMLAKVGHADEPPTAPDVSPKKPPFNEGNFLTVQTQSQPMVWFVDMNQMLRLEVRLKGETVTISADELFAALKTVEK